MFAKQAYLPDYCHRDVLAAEKMATHDKVRLQAAFINVVQDCNNMLTSLTGTDEQKKTWWKEHNIYFVDNYVDAALCAWRQGLLSQGSLLKICVATRVDYQKMMARRPTDFDWKGKSPWQATNKSLAMVEQELGEPIEKISIDIIKQPIDLTPKHTKPHKKTPAVNYELDMSWAAFEPSENTDGF